MKLRAVLTGDIINSNRLRQEEYKVVMKKLDEELIRLQDSDEISHYEIYRGDAFQAYIKDVEDGLSILFKVRTSINSLKPDEERRGQQPVYNIKLGLGVGLVDDEPQNLRTNEPPFVYSGQALEKITVENPTIAVKTEDEFINQELQTEFFLLEYILQRWTPTATDIIHKKLYGFTEREIAGKLEISQSAVNQHGRHACWHGIKQLIKRYKIIIKMLKNRKHDRDNSGFIACPHSD